MIDNIFLGGVKAKALYVGTSLVWSGSYNPSPYNPSELFGSGQQGTLYKYFDIANLFQDTSGTTPVTADGDPVGLVLDNSGNGINATQSVSSKRMVYKTSPPSLYLDKVDDELVINVPTGGWVGTMVLATVDGTASYGVSIPAGDYELGGRYFSSNNIVGALFRDGALTDVEKTDTESYFVDNGALASYGAVTDFDSAWRSFTAITDFPLIDTSSGISFSRAWYYCSSLTSFPLIDTSSGTNFRFTWLRCTSLTSFPLIDTSSGTDFYRAWFGCSSLTSFPLIDTSSGTTFRQTWFGCSSLTSFPLIDTSSGTTFRQTWYDCPSLTSFPLIDTSSATSFYSAWRGCSSLTSFPLIDTSSGTDFYLAWYDCPSLTSFPANAFDNVKGSDFGYAFYDTNLNQESIDGILVSLVTSGIATGTRDFYQSGGSAPSGTGNTAIDTLRSRGWDITVTGRY